MTKENTAANSKLFKFCIRPLHTSDAFLSCQDTGHPSGSWFRWLSSVKDQINKLLLELSTFFVLNIVFLKDARLVAQKNQVPHSCLQSSSSRNYLAKCWSPDYGELSREGKMDFNVSTILSLSKTNNNGSGSFHSSNLFLMGLCSLGNNLPETQFA